MQHPNRTPICVSPFYPFCLSFSDFPPPRHRRYEHYKERLQRLKEGSGEIAKARRTGVEGPYALRRWSCVQPTLHVLRCYKAGHSDVSTYYTLSTQLTMRVFQQAGYLLYLINSCSSHCVSGMATREEKCMDLNVGLPDFREGCKH